MQTRQAILDLVQSEKIKSGLISINHALEILSASAPEERMGTQKVIKLLLGMASQEIGLARKLTAQNGWDGIEALLERAEVMVDSGVPEEAMISLARAISLVTTVGQRAMIYLGKENLL